jgi:N-dimethylarginine dimethylaminohydrolase
MLNHISTISSRQQTQSTDGFALQRRKTTGVFEVAEVDMSEISKTGGGIHCTAQALCRGASA